MKKLLMASAAIAALMVAPALAADMAVKAPAPMPPPAPSWTGFYIGANGGYGWSSVNASETPFGAVGIAGITPVTANAHENGGVFGGQIGYNWQTGTWVWGIEGDFDGTGINGTRAVVFADPLGGAGGTATDELMVRADINWLASIRGRVGMTVGPSGLLYFTGGGAWENVKTTAMISTDTDPNVFSQSAVGSFNRTRSGFVVGGGYERMIAQAWTVRAEFLYYSFNGNTNAIPIADCSGCGVNLSAGRNNIGVARLGVNYMFNSYH